MDTKLLLLSPEGDIRQAYTDAINKLGVPFDTVDSFKELYNAMAKNPYSGVAIDLNTKLRAPQEGKSSTDNILERFPVVELRWDSETKKMGIFYQGQPKEGGSLEDYVKRICSSFDAKKISIEKRISINLSVTLASDAVFSKGNTEQTITINTSSGGCFLFTAKNWEFMDNVWFVIEGLNDRTPIRGEVRWCIEWGKGLHSPGIGVQFKDIKEGQVKEICNINLSRDKRNRARKNKRDL